MRRAARIPALRQLVADVPAPVIAAAFGTGSLRASMEWSARRRAGAATARNGRACRAHSLRVRRGR
jgi:hypothetical protein